MKPNSNIFKHKNTVYHYWSKYKIPIDKFNLASILNTYRDLFLDNYDIQPLTFIIPRDIKLLEHHFFLNPDTFLIAKPSNQSCGRGIFLFSNMEEYQKLADLPEDYIV